MTICRSFKNCSFRGFITEAVSMLLFFKEILQKFKLLFRLIEYDLPCRSVSLVLLLCFITCCKLPWPIIQVTTTNFHSAEFTSEIMSATIPARTLHCNMPSFTFRHGFIKNFCSTMEYLINSKIISFSPNSNGQTISVHLICCCW